MVRVIEHPRCEPAHTLVIRLGGPAAVSKYVQGDALTRQGDKRAVMLSASSVSRWSMPRHAGGTSGCIPLRYWPALIRMARAQGITLTIADLSDRVADALQEASWPGSP